MLDFYCAKSRLAVEIDGWSHGVGDQPDFDLERDLWFAGQGVETLRVPAHVVLSTPDEAAYNVWLAAAARAPTTAVPAVPLPRFAGEDQQG